MPASCGPSGKQRYRWQQRKYARSETDNRTAAPKGSAIEKNNVCRIVDHDGLG